MKVKYVKDLSKKDIKVLNSWKNKTQLNLNVEPHDTLESIYENCDKILEHIETHKTSKNSNYTHITRRDMIILLTRIMRDGGYEQTAQMLKEKYTQINNEWLKSEKKQKLDKNEFKNWVSHKDIYKRLVQLKANNHNNIISHYKYLLLSLMYYQPPLRRNYHNLQLIKNIADIQKDKNYLLNYGNKKYAYIIQNDKISKEQGAGIINIDSKTLNNIIYMSFKKYPRMFLFSNVDNNNEPIDIIKLDDIMTSLFNGKHTGIRIFRASYISWFYKNNVTIEKREELANKMRHSRYTAEMIYNKPSVKEYIKVEDVDNVPTDAGTRYREASAKYYKNNKYEISRKRHIKKANNTGIKPSDKIINKYDLKLDIVTGLYE